MASSRRPSAQAIRVLQALASDPARVALRLRPDNRSPPEIGLAVSDPDPACRPRTARNVLGARSTRPTAPAPVPTHPDGARVRGDSRRSSGRTIRAAPALGLERGLVISVPAIFLLIGRGRPSVLAILLLAGAGAVLWSREHPPSDSQTVRGDVPLMLLQWAVGLLRTDRVDWGQAMLGELDRIEGRTGGGASLSDARLAWCWRHRGGPSDRWRH